MSQETLFFMVTTTQYSYIKRLFYKPFYCGRGRSWYQQNKSKFLPDYIPSYYRSQYFSY
jgi:hypothetical protein